MKHADESRYDRRAKADHHSEYGADRCGDAESGHREDGWSVRNGGGLSFIKWKPEDKTISGDRTGVPGSQYAEAPAEVQRLDGTDHTARMRSSGRDYHLSLMHRTEKADMIEKAMEMSGTNHVGL